MEKHYVNRSNWLRAAVLGANDGILSTASIVIGVAAASQTREPILLAALAAIVAGALSMAAGEYVSVSSQSDIEKADTKREKQELENMPDHELEELAKIYQSRGVSANLAVEVAKQLTQHNALDAHLRDELGIHEISQGRPLQAALASAASFMIGGILPLIVALFFPISGMEIYQYVFAIAFLTILGAVSALTGGAEIGKAILRITLWGTLAMGLTALVGFIFGTQIG